MKKIKLIFSFIVSLLLVTQAFPQQTAKEILNKTLEAMGGKEKIENLRTIQFSGTEINNLPSIAVWNNGAKSKIFLKLDRFADITGMKLISNEKFSFNDQQHKLEIKFIYDNGVALKEMGNKKRPAILAQASYLKNKFYENPVFNLQRASKSNDLEVWGQEEIHGVMNYVLEFSDNNRKIKLLINSLDYLPSAIEYRFYDEQNVFDSYWGDKLRRVNFSSYILTPGGIKFPTKWITSSNGFQDTELAITKLTINPEISADTFKISDDLREAFLKQKPKSQKEFAAGNNDGSANLIVTGIYQSPGVETKYNSTIVKQNDGIVIIDAPYSSANSITVIEKAKELFSGEKIKAVISTNQLWMHIAGLREYAAGGIPIYVYKDNKNIVKKLLNADYLSDPDKLQNNKKQTEIRTVSTKMEFGTGVNRFEIIPVLTGTGQRTTVIYFPAKKLLYASDLYQPQRFAQNYYNYFVSEVKDLIDREDLNVEKVYSLHMPLIKYSKLINEK